MTTVEKNKQNNTYSKPENAQWSSIIDLRSKLDDGRKIDCQIISADINKYCAEIKFNPKNTNITKTIKYNTKINTDQKSEFEKFLENLGIAPTEKNIQSKLTNRTVRLNVTINDNKITLSHPNTSSKEKILDDKKIKKLKHILIGTTITSILFITIYVIVLYGIVFFLNIVFVGIISIFVTSWGCTSM